MICSCNQSLLILHSLLSLSLAALSLIGINIYNLLFIFRHKHQCGCEQFEEALIVINEAKIDCEIETFLCFIYKNFKCSVAKCDYFGLYVQIIKCFVFVFFKSPYFFVI